jgi:hypothetical protein
VYLRAATDNTVESTIDGSRAYVTYLFCIKRPWNFVDFVLMVLFLSENEGKSNFVQVKVR